METQDKTKLYRVQMKTVVYGWATVEAASEDEAITAAINGDIVAEDWEDFHDAAAYGEVALHVEIGLDGEQLAVPDVREVEDEEDEI
jgi:hypothetical protein